MTEYSLLQITDLHASVDGQAILQGIDLTIKAGEVHAIMGPNASGKSTLANVLAGRPGFEVTAGNILYQGKDLLALNPEQRAREGLFLGFQYPVEIPGVSNINLLKAAVNAVRNQQGLEELDAMDLLQNVVQHTTTLDISEDLLYRSVNEGFSGGEKKRNEILQMSVLQPQLAILDEIDSGLDIDALKIVANGINALRDQTRAFVLVTHYQRLLKYVQPDYVHVLSQGSIVRSGGPELAETLEAKGYGWLEHSEARQHVGTGELTQ